ncbi:hypothetical protein LZC95_07855 [Pendulispora brunnea]|uniref:Uncharacterized protein n=1 Tax=Pendulispora brunnea TaxID=2905690 RepID=A0ABZ2KDT0_9BACT
MPTHTTLSGQTIEYAPSQPVAQFLKRLKAMSEDPDISEGEMIAFAYGLKNPLLDHSIFPERGAVTKEVLSAPAYQVMTDLLARKRVQQDGIDVEKLAAEFTVSVSEAARELGKTPAAIRQAIQYRRVRAWMKTGPKGKQDYFLRPESVRTLGAIMRGSKDSTPGPLLVRVGHIAGNMVEIKHPGDLEDRKKDARREIIEGRIPRWKRVAFRYGGGVNQSPRLRVIEPADEPNEFTWGGEFFIRGNFKYVGETVNNRKRQEEEWATFQPL